MTTITESSDTILNAIENVASTALGLTEWSDADTAVTTSGSSTNYVDNGRVLAHDPSGMIVGLFAQHVPNFDDNNNYYSAGGIRVSLSTDWDTDNNSPAGNTNTISADPWSDNVGNQRSDSFSAHQSDYGSENAGHGIWTVHGSNSLSDITDPTVDYYGTVTADCLNLAVWDTVSEGGAAGVFSFEYVSQKFFADGAQPWAAWSNSSVGDGSGTPGNYSSSAAWAYHSTKNGNNSSTVHGDVYVGQGFDQSEWCMVNPDSDDDTYFFRRPVMYRSSGKGTPVAYIRQSIGNDVNEGGAHGDTIEHDGETYRMFRQSGGSMDHTISASLRYK